MAESREAPLGTGGELSAADKAFLSELPCGYFLFEPTPSTQYEVIERRTDIDPLVDAALGAMLDQFQGRAQDVRPYYQLPRMGRACAAPIPPPGAGFIVAKGGLGCSPGSESVRKLQDGRFQDSGCASVPVTPNINFLTIYKCATADGNGTEIIESIPEGYTPFVPLLLDYRFSRNIYETLGVAAPLALGLLRHPLGLPWSTDIDARQQIMANLRAQLPPQQQILPITYKSPWYYNVYTGSDTGLFFRQFQAATRLQDFYDAVVAGQWQQLHNTQEMQSVRAQRFLEQLAASAGILTQHGIIHGQLFYDLQNISINGEICDMNETLVTPYTDAELHQSTRATLHVDEQRFGVSILDNYQERLGVVAPDETEAAKRVVEQAYYLWNAALRYVDLAQRSGNYDARPGSVLNDSDIDHLRHVFGRRMVAHVGEQGRKYIKQACRAGVDAAEDFRTTTQPPMLKFLLDNKLATIFGWTNPEREFNHFSHSTTTADVAFILADYRKFTQALLDTL